LPEDPAEPGGHIELQQTRVETRGDFGVNWGAFDRLDYGFQHSDYRHTEFEGDGAAGTHFTSEGWEGRVEIHHGDGRHDGALGVQFSDVDFAAEGDEAFITATNTQDSGVFAVERYDLGSWGVEGGVRFERREIDNATFGSRDFDTVSGSLGLFVRPAEGWFVGATLARTERAPTASELFSDGPHLATANYEVGDPLLGANAHRGQAQSGVPIDHGVNQRCGDPRAAGPQGVPDRDSSPAHVDPFRIHIKHVDAGERLCRKCLIQLNQIDIIELQSGPLQRFLRGWHRTGPHDGRLDARHGRRADAHLRFQVQSVGCLLGHHQHGGCSVVQRRAVPGRDRPHLGHERRL
jgi:hypothetical protein